MFFEKCVFYIFTALIFRGKSPLLGIEKRNSRKCVYMRMYVCVQQRPNSEEKDPDGRIHIRLLFKTLEWGVGGGAKK